MSNIDFEKWVSQVASWQETTKQIPAMVHDDLILKSKYNPDEASRGLKSHTFDPLAVQYSMGFKDRKYSLSYDVLKRIPQQLSIVAAIIQTRCNQVASFSVPFRSSKSLGFVVKHKDPGKLTTKGEREMIKSLENFIYNCGHDKPNPHNLDVKRDDFETFLRKVVRDSLMYDQLTYEVVPDHRGMPYEFMAVDASTIRLATQKSIFGPNNTWHNRPAAISNEFLLSGKENPYRTMQLYSKDPSKRPSFVQVINGQIENVYTQDELAFGVRNPRTDIYIQGYGYGELEQLVTVITSHLYAEEYNRRFFMQGSAPKGMLVFKGDTMTPDQLEAFKRQWRSNLEGVENAWRTPIIQSEQGAEWMDLGKTNQEMEYNAWIEYLIKITCGVFLIDPAELNFDLHGGVSQTPLFESSQEWKLKASRDRGLKPLLRFIAKMINDNIINKIDDHFMFDFVGLDELTEQEKHELRKEQVSSYKTLNEIRRAEDLPDVEHGDMVLNPTYIQAMQAAQQMEQQKQQQQQMAQQQGGGDQGAGGEQGGEQPETPNTPAYADNFTKSIQVSSGTKFLEISLDDWLTEVRNT